MKVITGELHRVRRGRGKGFAPKPDAAAKPAVTPESSPSRAAITLAFAHLVQRAIDRGEIKDQAEVARRLGVTRARVTQLVGLTLVTPQTQDRVLLLNSLGGVEPLAERNPRRSAALAPSS